MADPAQRVRILHGFANHELQAVELFAWAVLAFPDAPPEFRQGLWRILREEQRHTRMYMARLEAHGSRFGAFPVNAYFWGKVARLTTPSRFVCALSLTFELMEEGDQVLAVSDGKTSALLRYSLLRLPDIFSQVLPIATLDSGFTKPTYGNQVIINQ